MLDAGKITLAQRILKGTQYAVKIVFAFAAMLFGYLDSNASESILLDSLVSKNIISYQEAIEIKKSAVEIPIISAAEPETLLEISARAQTQFEYLNIESTAGSLDGDSASLTRLILRRVVVSFNSDTRRDWGVQIMFDFLYANKLSITYIWKKVDLEYLKGEIRLGYIKPNFCNEENLSFINLYAVERSLATYYWTGPRNERRLGFGSFMTGAYWFGNSVSIKGLKYAMGVSNSENYRLSVSDDGDRNAPNLWLSASYDTKIYGGKFTFGLNLGYGAEANKETLNKGSSIWGANPYIKFEYGKTRAAAELLSSGIDDGLSVNDNYEKQYPLGVNFMVEKRYDAGFIGELAPVFRFTYLDTDGRGVYVFDGFRQTPSISGDTPYNSACGYYFGVNWYVMGNNIKIQLGYEFSQYSGGASSIGAHKLEGNTLRSQFQVMF